MPNARLLFHCKYCNKTITLNFSEEAQAKFKDIADKWPYPLIYQHNDHWVVVYVDTNFQERGVIPTKFLLDEKDANEKLMK
jgi:hypothetical protein